MEMIEAKKDISPDLVRGSWDNKKKVLTDAYSQEWKITVDKDSIEKSSEGIIIYMPIDLKKVKSKIPEDALIKNMMEESEVDNLTWSFPYWQNKRPVEGSGIVQKRETKGGLAYDGLVMLDYKIYKINLWENSKGDTYNIDGKEEKAEKARLAELNNKK